MAAAVSKVTKARSLERFLGTATKQTHLHLITAPFCTRKGADLEL